MMTWEIAFVLFLIGAALVSFLYEKVSPDVTALALFVVLLVSGLVPQEKIFGVLSNPAPLTVGAMFILSAALVKTGLIDRMAVSMEKISHFSYPVVMALVVIVAGTISAFVNNTPVVVVLVPVILSLARKMNIPASKMLMPLSHAAVLGGVCTLIGTSTNLVVAGILQSRGVEPLTMFELSPLGFPMLAAGTVYIALAGKFLLPTRQSNIAGSTEADRRDYLTEAYVQPGSPTIGKTAEEAGLTEDRGIRLIEIIRNEYSLPLENPTPKFEAGDRLVLSCRPQGVTHTRSIDGIDLMTELKIGLGQISAHEGVIVEGVVAPQSDLIGQTVRRADLRGRHHVVALGAHRHGRQLGPSFDKRPLQNGDVLLLMGSEQSIENLRNNKDILLVDRPRLPARRSARQIAIVVGSIVSVILVSSLDWMNIEVAALLACALIFITKCLPPREGYAAIEWNLLFLIYGMLAVGVAMEHTGTSEWVVDKLLFLVNEFVPQDQKPMVMLAAFYLLAMILTELLSNNAVAALLTPLALSLGEQLGVDPRPYVIAVCIAASVAFSTPIGYQTNTYIYGVGGYRFADFVKFGLPLNILCFVLAMLLIPLLWPF